MAEDAATARLIIISEQGHVFFELDGQNSCSLGRSPENDVVLRDSLTSRSHAIIEPCEGGYQLRDLNSHNGCYLNGERISEELLRSWDAARVGRTLIFFLDPRTLSRELGAAEFAQDDPTSGASALDRMQVTLAHAMDELGARELIETARRELRQAVLDQVLGSVRRASIPSSIPECDRLTILSHRIAAVEGGGDFLVCVERDGILSMAIGTVRGWGLTAALHGSIARAAVQSVLLIAQAPTEILAGHVQRVLESSLPAETACHFAITRILPRGELEATFCGRVSALIARGQGGADILRAAEDASRSLTLSISATLSRGDQLILASEGVLRSHSEGAQRLSTAALRELARSPAAPASLLETLSSQFSQHSRYGQSADATFVVIARS